MAEIKHNGLAHTSIMNLVTLSASILGNKPPGIFVSQVKEVLPDTGVAVVTDAYLSAEEERKGILSRESRLLTAFRKDLARRGLSHSKVEQHVGAIQTFGQTFLLVQDPPRSLLDMNLADVQSYLSKAGNKQAVTSFKRFVRFLSETDRMDYDQSEPLREFL